MRGSVLRARRIALGRSVEEVAEATKIPVAHLRALEDEREHDLPAGPYAQAYARTLARHLGIDEAASEEAPAAPAAPPQGAPLWLVRAMALTSLVALVVVLGSVGWERLRPVLDRPAAAPVADQRVVIEARRTTTVRVGVDGARAQERAIAGGERIELAARDRVEVDVPVLADVRIEWNGETVVPQGRQDAPRRLVFVDDR